MSNDLVTELNERIRLRRTFGITNSDKYIIETKEVVCTENAGELWIQIVNCDGLDLSQLNYNGSVTVDIGNSRNIILPQMKIELHHYFANKKFRNAREYAQYSYGRAAFWVECYGKAVVHDVYGYKTRIYLDRDDGKLGACAVTEMYDYRGFDGIYFANWRKPIASDGYIFFRDGAYYIAEDQRANIRRGCYDVAVHRTLAKIAYRVFGDNYEKQGKDYIFTGNLEKWVGDRPRKNNTNK